MPIPRAGTVDAGIPALRVSPQICPAVKNEPQRHYIKSTLTARARIPLALLVGVLRYRLCIVPVMAVPRVSLFFSAAVCGWTFTYLAILFTITP